MARIKRVLLVRHNGETTKKVSYTPQVVKRPNPSVWERACMMGGTDQQRRQLTKGQWVRYSELRRGLKIVDPYMIIKDASLDTLESIMRTVNIMDTKRALYHMQTV